MATATSKAIGAFVLVAAALVLANCGGDGGAAPSSSRFGWLHPTRLPAGWSAAPLPTGTAIMAYPPHWRRIAGDPGTVSAALVGTDDNIVGYLNATPRQANETLSNWATFRPNHNAHEGDHHVHTLAATRTVPFRSGHASCVIDTYRTIRTAYREIACVVVRDRNATVIVAASTTAAWPDHYRQLERAVQAFRT